jgi:hypothetical protein
LFQLMKGFFGRVCDFMAGIWRYSITHCVLPIG